MVDSIPGKGFLFRHRRALLLGGIFLLALFVRSLTAYFMAAHINESGWFPSAIYDTFHRQASDVLDGRAHPFWIDDASKTDAAIYPPGYSLWLALIYSVGGVRSPLPVQAVQAVLDSFSVFLIVLVTVRSYSWRAGIAAGFLAALSPLLAIYGATPLSDAPTGWVVTGGMLLLLVAVQKQSPAWALAAGSLIGASCWLRSNGLLLAPLCAVAAAILVSASLKRRLLMAFFVALGASVLIAPIIARNSYTFGGFVPTGLGAGTNLWEGIGETDRAAEFGAVYGDKALLERERIEMGRPGDESIQLYWPDGPSRDRARMQKAFNVIAAHPVWYAGIMLRRMAGHLKYAGSTSPIYGSAGLNVMPSTCLPPGLRLFPLTVLVGIVGSVQFVLRIVILPLMLAGIVIGWMSSRRMTLLLLTPILYYLVVGCFMHSEIRYSLPMQALMFVFGGVAVQWLVSKVLGRYRTIRQETIDQEIES